MRPKAEAVGRATVSPSCARAGVHFRVVRLLLTSPISPDDPELRSKLALAHGLIRHSVSSFGLRARFPLISLTVPP